MSNGKKYIIKCLKILSSAFLGLLSALIVVCFVYAVNQIFLLSICDSSIWNSYLFWIVLVAIIDGILIHKALYDD